MNAPGAAFSGVAALPVDPGTATVYEHGWQSWSPAGRYPVTATSPRPKREIWQTMAFRPERPAPDLGFQGEGLLAVQGEPGSPVEVFAAPDPTTEVPSIRARLIDDRLVITADGEITHTQHEGDLPGALAAWAAQAAARAGVGQVASVDPGWCSWYCYWDQVTEDDVLAELAVIERQDLPIATVQIDDGWQAGIGDWTTTSDRFGSMADLADRIAQTGRRAGIWTAPFLVGERSQLAADHPDWLVDGAVACAHHWDQEARVLDVTHPAATEHLHEVFATLRGWGYRYFKIDFLYAGAMIGGRHGDADPIAAYREGMRIIRDAIGPGSVLLGCGAPLLPSLGLVDAMRISPDVDPETEPADGDVSQPGLRSALLAGRARAFLHDRWWVNDPDCVVVRPEVQRREEWAAYCDALGGLAVSSDFLGRLDDRGLELTRQLLRPSRAAPAAWDPEGPEQGRVLPPGTD